MAATKTTKPHLFYWTPLNSSQSQTEKSRCNECGSRASHPVHNEVVMTQKEAIKMLKKEKEIVALEPQSYALFLSLGLALLHQGVFPIAKVSKGF
jgi:hypothetical protein